MDFIELIRKYGVDNIERGIVLNYFKTNDIAISSHPYFLEYLDNYCPSSDLMSDISSLCHSSLADLAVDMERLIPVEDRETNGAFFTPQIIVDYILDTISPSENAKVIDISCGSGAFLLGILRFFTKTYSKAVADVIRDNLYGVDLLNYNVRRSKILIMLYALSKGECVSYDSINIVCDNSLTRDWQQEYDAVVGNPPYVKFQDMTESTREILQSNYTTTSFGTYNLYFAFFEIGHKILNQSGKLGFITPNNYFTSLSGESLRLFFQQTQSVNRIVDFSATKVFEVQTYTAITFLTKESNNSIEYSRIKYGDSILTYLSSVSFTDNNYENLNEKKWRLLCGNEREVISTIENAGEHIGSLFNIAVGIATLKDEAYFVLPYDEDEVYYYCNNKYLKNFKIEKEITRSLVKISKIKVPDDLHRNNRRIIFPYIIENNSASVISEEYMRNKYPSCYSYMSSVKEVLDGRGKGKHKYTPFFAYGRTQGLNKTGIKIYTPTFSQYPSFIFDENQSSLFTNGYALFYKTTNSDSLFADVNPICLEENSDVLLKILNSGLMHFYISRTSVSIDGGYPCYQKNFIERFSIPLLTNDDVRQLRSLTDRDVIDNYLLTLYQINLPSPNLWE